MTYTSATSTFTMTGDVTANVAGVSVLTVDFGGGSTQGLVITNGKLTTLNMTVASGFSVAGMNFSSGLVINYQQTASGSMFARATRWRRSPASRFRSI